MDSSQLPHAGTANIQPAINIPTTPQVDALTSDLESVLSRDSLDVGDGSVHDSVSLIRSVYTSASGLSTPVQNNSPSNSSPYQPLTNAPSHLRAKSPPPPAVRKPPPQRKSKGNTISWWWWWEIGGALLSIICMGLILGVLFKANNLALADWPLWIQPNSLISVFTTVGKSAMMVPIASCISQLKWRHFERRANRLSHLQVLDEASRGPWGSLMALFNLRLRALMVSALAIVSLVALGFEPSAQQILDFPTRGTKLTNTSASIGVASAYESKGFIEDTDGSTGHFDFANEWNQDLFKLQSSIIDGLSGSIFQPAFSCPGDYCSWAEFTTLGICGDFLNLTDRIEVKCTGRFDDQQNCSYQFPLDIPLNSYYTAPFVLNMSYAEQNAGTSKPTTIFSSQGDIGDTGSGSMVLFSIKVINDTQQYANFSEAPQVEAYYSTWYWCAQTFYNVSATPSRISNVESTTEMLWKSDEISSGQYLDGSAYIPLIANSTGRLFNVSANVNTNLFPYIYKLLTREIVDVYPHAGSYNDDESLDLSTFLYTTDMKNATESMAQALTNQIRSSAPGDNSRATAFAGDTFINETYIRVTWPWFILPLAETLGTTVLLITNMILSRHNRLLKTSLIALLVYGLDGWRADEIKIPDPEDAEKLEAMAHVMRARLMDNGNGRFQFVRA